MNRRAWVQAVLVTTVVTTTEAPIVAASGTIYPDDIEVVNSAARSHRRPHILGGLSPSARFLLRIAFGRARQRMRSADCASLFYAFDSQPHVVLSRAIYTEPHHPSDRAICRRRSAAAFTTVGPGRTVICPRFAHLSANEAAAILLHEALHNAGQTEWPSDPEAPSSAQIQARVRTQCRL